MYPANSGPALSQVFSKSPKTSVSRIATTGFIGIDRVRTGILSVIFLSLRLLHLLMWSQVTFVRSRYTFLIVSSRSSYTIDRTPSRNSRTIVTLFPCLFVKASTTIRSCRTHLHLALSVSMLPGHAQFLCCPSATSSSRLSHQMIECAFRIDDTRRGRINL